MQKATLMTCKLVHESISRRWSWVKY